MTKYNQWGEPMPQKSTGPKARAWARVLIANEWFDGEDGIAASAQDRMLREWDENLPSTVSYLSGWGNDWKYQLFPTRRDAEAWLDRNPHIDYSTVRPTK